MTIIGHGIDLVELESLDRLLCHAAEDFLDECFTAEERANMPSGPQRLAHIAGRFAAKEAVMKAIGTGFGNGVAFADVEIGRSPAGTPSIRLADGAAHLAATLGITTWFLSISHGEKFAIASAIAVRMVDSVDTAP